MKKAKNEFLILGGAIVVLVLVYVFFTNGNSGGRKTPELPKIQRDAITRLTLSKPAASARCGLPVIGRVKDAQA